MTTHAVLSVSEAGRLGVAGLVRQAEAGGVVVERHGRPVAAVVSMAHLEQLEAAADDLTEAAVLLARLRNDDGTRVGLDEVFAEFGLDRAELQAEVDAEEASAPASERPLAQ